MSDARENEERRQSKSERAIAANDASESGGLTDAEKAARKAAADKKKREAAAKKKREAEKVGTGQPSFDTDAAVARIKAQAAATSDPTLKAKLLARAAAVRANAP